MSRIHDVSSSNNAVAPADWQDELLLLLIGEVKVLLPRNRITGVDWERRDR